MTIWRKDSIKMRHHLITFALLTIPLAVLAFFGSLPRSSGDIRALYPNYSASVEELDSMTALFGDSIVDMIVLRSPVDINDDFTEELNEIADTLALFPGVIKVLNPVESFSRIAPPIRLRSDDGAWLRFIIEIDGHLDDTGRARLDQQLNLITKQLTKRDALRSGVFYVSESATSAINSENIRWTPVSALLLLIACRAAMGTWRLTLIVLLTPLITLLWLSAGLVLLNVPLLPISQLVPPLLLAVSASYSSYVAGRRVLAIGRRDPSLLAGLSASLSLAAATTIIGFISLLSMRTHAVNQFAVLMTIGTLISAVLSYVLTSHQISPKDAQAKNLRALERWGSLSLPMQHRTLTVLLFSILCVTPAIGFMTLSVDTNPLDFLPHGGQVQQSLQEAMRRFPGTHVLNVSFRRNDGEALHEDDFLELQNFSKSVKRMPAVHGVIYYKDFLELKEKLAQRGADPDDPIFTGWGSRGPHFLTTADGRVSRMLIETDLEGEQLRSLAYKLQTMKPANSTAAAVRITPSSRELIMAEQASQLAHGLLFSVVTAIILVGGLLWLSLRDLRLTAVGLIPNILPIIALLGSLGLFIEQVNLGAAMVAAVALGMISDNTFHFLFSWRAYCHSSVTDSVENRLAAIRAAYAANIGPFCSTAVILILGFSATDFSPLRPLMQFGIFLGVALFLGLVSNLLLLPWLLRYCFSK